MAPRKGRRSRTAAAGGGTRPGRRESDPPPAATPPRRSGRKRAPSRAWIEASEAEREKRVRHPRKSILSCEEGPEVRATPPGREQARVGRTRPRASPAPRRAPRGTRDNSGSSPAGTGGSWSSSADGRAQRGRVGTRRRVTDNTAEVANRLLSVILDTLEDRPAQQHGDTPEESSFPNEDDDSSSSAEEEQASGPQEAARRGTRRPRQRRRLTNPGSEGDVEDSPYWGECSNPRLRRPETRRRLLRRRNKSRSRTTQAYDTRTARQVWGRAKKGRKESKGKRRRGSSTDSVRDYSTLSSDTSERDSDNPLPPGLPDTPLSMHMSQALKKKIWRGAYVDMFTLLLPEKSKKEKLREKKGGAEAKEPKMDMGILSWAYAYLAYHSVVVEKDVQRTHEMIPYMNMIFKAYHEFGGSAWRQYDESFRRYAAHHKDWPWDRKHPDLWLQATQQTTIPAEGRTPTGHLLLSRNKETFLPRPGFGPGGAGSGQRGGTGQGFRNSAFCYEYGAKGTCARAQCRFRHACAHCNGRHPASTCFRAKGAGAKDASTTPKLQQGGSAGKGPNTH